MDIKLWVWTILAACLVTQVESALRCIECTHISWKQLYDFEGAANIYRILRSKYNPACAQENPLDRNQFNYNQQIYSEQSQSLGIGLVNYDVGETICKGNSPLEKCHYIRGNATIHLPGYDAKMDLNIHVRSCQTTKDGTYNKCYERSGQYGNHETQYFIQNRLTFLSRDVQLQSFKGQECYCDTTLCRPIVASARNIVASSVSIVLAMVSVLLLS